MGVGLRRYRFNSEKDGLTKLKNAISKQVDTYLPTYQGSEVTLTLTKDKKLNIDITVGDTTYVYSSEVDDTIDTIDDLIAN